MLNAIKWFKIHYKDRLDKNTFRNTTIFPIVWNLYESSWWNTEFKIYKLEEHIDLYLMPIINVNEKFQKMSETLYSKLLEYRNLRGYSNVDHYISLNAGDFHHLHNIFVDKNNSTNLKDKLWVLIWTAYRVRCNMFHGSKDLLDYQEINMQSSLFEVLNDFIVLLVVLKQKR